MAGWAAVKIEARGWGMEDADHSGYIRVNGQTLVVTGEEAAGRGLHVVTLHSADGGYVMRDGVRHYDTHGDAAEADEMARFLSAQPEGAVIVVVSADDFTSELKREPRKVISELGVKLGFTYRSSVALVAVRGDPTRATVAERAAGSGPASITVVM